MIFMMIHFFAFFFIFKDIDFSAEILAAFIFAADDFQLFMIIIMRLMIIFIIFACHDFFHIISIISFGLLFSFDAFRFRSHFHLCYCFACYWLFRSFTLIFHFDAMMLIFADFHYYFRWLLSIFAIFDWYFLRFIIFTLISVAVSIISSMSLLMLFMPLIISSSSTLIFWFFI